MATVLAFDSVEYKVIKRKINSPILLTYGQPRTVNDLVANEIMKNIPIVWRVVRKGDLIASMPRCRTWFLSQQCETFLKDTKFTTEEIKLTEQQKKYERDYYYAFHIGGLILFDEEMKSYMNCGKDYGDNHPNNQCHIKLTIYPSRHKEYFGQKVSQICVKSNDIVEDDQKEDFINIYDAEKGFLDIQE